MTSIWGPTYWNFFHLITTLYPHRPSNKDKQVANTFLNTIDKVLPCHECARHFRSNKKKIPIKNDLASKKKFIKWFINFHNLVNKMTKKKILPYNESLEKIKRIDKNIVTHFKNILGFVVYILPPKNKIDSLRINGIKQFIKSTMYLGKMRTKKKSNINFNDKKSYIKMYKNLIKNIIKK
jgi:hypothetical protein